MAKSPKIRGVTDKAGGIAPAATESLLGVSASRRAQPTGATHGNVAEAHRAFLSAMDRRRLAGVDDRREPDPDHEGPILEAAVQALRAYHHPSNWRDGRPIEPLSPEVAFYLAGHLDHFLNGALPPAWAVLRQRKGGKAPDVADQRLDAVRYAREAQSGRIADPAWAETLAFLFCVSSRAVRQWVESLPPPPALPAGLDGPDMDLETVLVLAERSGEAFAVMRGVNVRKWIEDRPKMLARWRAIFPGTIWDDCRLKE